MNPSQDGLLHRIEELERQVKELQIGRRDDQDWVSTGGTFKLIPPDGDPPSLVNIGTYIKPDGSGTAYGASFYDKDYAIVFGTNEARRGNFGLMQNIPQRLEGTASVTGAFQTVALFQPLYLQGDCMYTVMGLSIPVGSTANVRMTNNGVLIGNTLTGILAGAAGAEFCYIHSMDVAWDTVSNPVGILRIQVALNSGAGPITVSYPQTLTCLSQDMVGSPTPSAVTPWHAL